MRATQGACSATSPPATIDVIAPDGVDEQCRFPLSFFARTLRRDVESRFIQVTPQGTDGPYAYRWRDGTGNDIGTTGSAIFESFGQYTVRVTDAEGDYSDGIYHFGRRASGSANVLPESCSGANDGVIAFGPYSAYAPIGGELDELNTVTISILDANGNVLITRTTGILNEDGNGDGSGRLDNLAPGTYTIRIEPDNGTVVTREVEVSSAPTREIRVETVTAPTCDQANGTVNVTYLEDGIDRTAGATISIVQQGDPSTLQISAPPFSGLAAGSYNITVDNNGPGNCECTTTTTYNLEGLAPPAPLTVDPRVTHNLCFGAAEGSIDLRPDGGTAPYTITWDTPTGDAEALTAGTYAYTITDASGCYSLEDMEAVGEPSEIEINCEQITPPDPRGNADVQVDVSGGVAPYTLYVTFNGTDIPTLPFTDLQIFPDQPPGEYRYRIVDFNGCERTCTLTIDAPDCGVILLEDIVPINPSCNSAADGSIEITATGGIAPYTATWSGPGTFDGSLTQTGLGPGTYRVTVTDDIGCVSSTQSIELTEPDELTVTAQLDSVVCYGEATGAISLEVTGETPPYTYAWSDGADAGAERDTLRAGEYTVTISSGACTSTVESYSITEPDTAITLEVQVTNELSCFGDTDASIEITAAGGTGDLQLALNGELLDGPSRDNLGTGSYNLTATDAEGCIGEIEFFIDTPAELVLDCDNTDVTISGGSNGTITGTIMGGTAPYVYEIDGDEQPVDNLSFEIEGRPSGPYAVTVRDANGCEKICTGTIAEPACELLAFDPFQIVDPLCAGSATGSFNLEATGGVAPYTYTIDDIDVEGGLITGRAAGDYIVSVVDDVNCVRSTTITLADPDPISLSCSTRPIAMIDAEDGSITVGVENGTGPYEVTLNDVIQPGPFPDTTTTIELNGLGPGRYVIVVTDANQCSAECDEVINAIECSAPEFTLVPTSPSCAGGDDGTIMVIPVDPANSYTYTSEAGPIVDSILSNLTEGEYEIRAVDGSGCDTTLTTIVVDPDSLTLACDHRDVTTNMGSDGRITIDILSGDGPYTFKLTGRDSINTPESSVTFSGLPAGDYTAVVTTRPGCIDSCILTVNQPACQPLDLAPTLSNPNCAGGNDGSITFNLPGVDDTQYTVTVNGDTVSGFNIEDLTAGEYVVAFIDANSCTTSDTFTLEDPPLFEIECTAPPIVTLGGDTVITVNIEGGQEVFTVVHPNGPNVQTDLRTVELPGYGAGRYEIVVNSFNGCVDTCTVTIDSVSCPVIDLDLTPNAPTCTDGNDGVITVDTNSPDTLQFTANGVPFDGNIFRAATAQLYTIEGIGSRGCIYSGTITVPPTSTPFTVTCTPTEPTGPGAAEGAGNAELYRRCSPIPDYIR